MKFNRYILIFTVGLLLLVGGYWLLGYVRANESVVSVSPSVAASPAHVRHTPTVIEGQPTRLAIPSLKMDLPIINGYYNSRTGEWTLTRNKVQFATISAKPNDQSGNTFLYGHYRREVFASLHTIQPGATALVKTKNGHTFTYKLRGIRVISPAQSAGLFDYTGKPILTIQTCTGLFFQKRQLFTFDLVKVT